MKVAIVNWRKAATEFVVIVFGVLAALAIDQWNNDRLDRLQERTIIERLLVDLQDDLVSIDLGLNDLPRKQDSLHQLDSVFATDGGSPGNSAKFLQDVISGAGYGWNQRRARRTTFEELVGAGRFSLIRDSDLRVRVSEYYAFDLSTHNRIDERETQYPHLSYQLVPRSSEYVLMSNLSPIAMAQIVDRVLESELRDHVTAELNLAVFMGEEFRVFRAAILELIDELEQYLERIS